jgi:hypothetical protein
MKRITFWFVLPCSWWKPDVAEEYIASIFRVDQEANQGICLLPASASFSLVVILDAEDGGGAFISNIELSLNYITSKSIKSKLFTILLILLSHI